jgi:hypothetical protein
MGRGRQKAKHTKVARDLKYFSPDTNYGALQRELATAGPVSSEYDKWAEEFGDDDDDDLDEDDESDDNTAQTRTA